MHNRYGIMKHFHFKAFYFHHHTIIKTEHDNGRCLQGGFIFAGTNNITSDYSITLTINTTSNINSATNSKGSTQNHYRRIACYFTSYNCHQNDMVMLLTLLFNVLALKQSKVRLCKAT